MLLKILVVKLPTPIIFCGIFGWTDCMSHSKICFMTVECTTTQTPSCTGITVCTAIPPCCSQGVVLRDYYYVVVFLLIHRAHEHAHN